MMAVGWPGNADALNLAAADVRTERSYIAVNDALQTSAPHIYAAGDITGRMMLVQSATYEARVATENAVGATQMASQHQNADLDRAVIDGYTDGFCKLVVSRTTREILGAHVIGEQAVQMIAAGMGSGMRVEHLAQLELAYPTYTAIVGLAARQIVRELGVVPLAPAWRALLHPCASEWERSHSSQS